MHSQKALLHKVQYKLTKKDNSTILQIMFITTRRVQDKQQTNYQWEQKVKLGKNSLTNEFGRLAQGVGKHRPHDKYVTGTNTKCLFRVIKYPTMQRYHIQTSYETYVHLKMRHIECVLWQEATNLSTMEIQGLLRYPSLTQKYF